jgi:hypothetical protein
MSPEAGYDGDGAGGAKAPPGEELPGVEIRSETQEYAGETPTQTGRQYVNRTA